MWGITGFMSCITGQRKSRQESYRTPEFQTLSANGRTPCNGGQSSKFVDQNGNTFQMTYV